MRKKLLTFVLAITLIAQAGSVLAVTADDIEALVEADLGIGAITTYLELTSDNPLDSPAGPDTREGLTLATAGDTWGYPDGSDGSLWVNENCLDEKDHAANDFLGTISGLSADTDYGLYVVAAGRKQGTGVGTYDFSFGASSAENIVPSVYNAPGAVQIAESGSADITTSTAVPIGFFTSDGSGDLAIYLGKGQSRDGNNYRTQLDGLVVGEGIPEPMTLALLGLGGLGLIRRRRK